ncbi:MULTISPECIES: cadherin-like domain-containing protein [unclassified Coleofasciculus]|uniref:cadherin-like domain-containing protein n=1 Tax=unclassified Coleofasciculus TaxID=2692782 RepID=UPI001882EB92|nr:MULTISPECIES: cadherin-like domain-containing protein [unclassified Coleofasciculus]MBE9129796.1 cadherin-like domain-containing protein [Coleofasciculus sp. LEGE 07081]MBE9152255.1 cadherin-like domain-containing protein [Coleofasciculus sp. LEGE 07092]
MATTLFDGQTTFEQLTSLGLGVPGKRWLAYGQIPMPSLFSTPPVPLATNAGTATLNTNFLGGNPGYAGYTNYNPLTALNPPFSLLNPNFPILDNTTGFALSFNVAVTAEQSQPNRAGFSVTLIDNNGQGIELGFKEEGDVDRIFAQSANFIEAEAGNTNINVATNYILTFIDDTYSLSADGIEILTGQQRNYNFNPATSSPPLPFNPYISPNFLFFGDNTDQGNATFTLGEISVNTFPVAVDDAYTTNEDTALNVPIITGLLSNDKEADSDELTATVVDEPTNGTLTLNPDGSFTYAPIADFSGIDSFTYQINDGTADSLNPATVDITVNAV